MSQNAADVSASSLKSRKTHHCRTCGSPMRGHKKGGCNVVDTIDDLAPELVRLSISQKSRDSFFSEGTNSGQIENHRAVSLSERTTLPKGASSFRRAASCGDDKFTLLSAAPPKRPIMPGTLADDDDENNDHELVKLESDDIPAESDNKGSPSPYMCAPYIRTSLRLQRARNLDPDQFGVILRSMFIKTAVQPAALFSLNSLESEGLERAAKELGLHIFYYERGTLNPDAEVGADMNLVIVGVNGKAIEDMTQSITKETENLAPPGTSVRSFFLKQMTAAGIVVGAAAMWVGLAFA